MDASNVFRFAVYNVLVPWITANPDWHPRQSQAKRLFLCELGTSLTSSHALECLTCHSGKQHCIQSCACFIGVFIDNGSSFPACHCQQQERTEVVVIGNAAARVQVI